MATHPSILAWRIPGTEEHGGLLSMGYQTQLQRLSSSSMSFSDRFSSIHHQNQPPKCQKKLQKMASVSNITFLSDFKWNTISC